MEAIKRALSNPLFVLLMLIGFMLLVFPTVPSVGQDPMAKSSMRYNLLGTVRYPEPDRSLQPHAEVDLYEVEVGSTRYLIAVNLHSVAFVQK